MRRILMLFMLLLAANFTYANHGVEITSNLAVASSVETGATMATGNSSYVVSCARGNETFFADRPGVHKPYLNSSDYYTTICPSGSDKRVRVSFQQFSLEKFDNLTIWDEAASVRTGPVFNRQAAIDKINEEVSDQEWRDKMIMELGPDTRPEILNTNVRGENDGIDFIGSFTRKSSPGTITSSRGCLTFRFRSDATVVEPGWYARVTCVDAPAPTCDSFNSRYVDSDLKCGVKIVDDNFRGHNDFEIYGSCTMPGWPASGNELIYRFVNHKASDLVFTFNEYNGSQPKKLNMFILNNCNVNACVAAITRPADNPNQSQNQITISNAAAGVYYVVIDGNKPYAHHQFDLLVECTGGDATLCNAGTDGYYSDFEAPRYFVGENVTRFDPFWYKNKHSVGLRDAKISRDRASNGTQSLEFNRSDEGIQDVYLDLDDRFTGRYRICWDMYIENHHTAFFGLFGGDNSDPWGTVSREFEHGNSYTGRWFNVELFVDLDRNRYTLFLDNRCESSGGAYNLNLDKLNFYGLPKAHFYVDNICYSRWSPRTIPSPSSNKVVVLDGAPNVMAEKEKLGLTATDNEETTRSLGLTSTTVELNELQAVPNPTRGMTQITLNLAQEQNVTLELFSHTGQMVRTISTGKTAAINAEVDLSDLANGMYMLRATGEQSVITKKIVLQR